MNIKILATAVALAVACSSIVKADGGMWLPTDLAANADTMQALGCQLTPDDIYSNDTLSLKDAIVDFDGGCSGSFISADGLVLTNYHCGYDRIQQLSSTEHDYLTDGYWATCRNDELPCPGATVRVLMHMADVTHLVLDSVSDTMDYYERNQLIQTNIDKIIDAAKTEPSLEPEVEATYGGNRYHLYVYRTYTDIRLVGAPPSSIGKFGGDTDNWMWPRHTGDFSIFRVYADSLNLPSDDTENNRPYQPLNHLTISLDGAHEGDFTLVYGQPGFTTLYRPAEYAAMLRDYQYPRIVELRTAVINTMQQFEDASADARIRYAAKHASVSNSWKRMQGEIQGMKAKKVVERKLLQQQQLLADTTAADILKQYAMLYGSVGSDTLSANAARRIARALINEVIRFSALELCQLAYQIRRITDHKDLNDDDIAELSYLFEEFYVSYLGQVDQAVASASLVIFVKYMPDELLPVDMRNSRSDIPAYVGNLFKNSILDNQEQVRKLLTQKPEKIYNTLTNDAAYLLTEQLIDIRDNKIDSYYADNQTTTPIAELDRKFIALQLNNAGGHPMPPDATGTFRVSYGQVRSCTPRDAVSYRYYSTIDGIAQKRDTTIYDYNAPQQLIDLWQSKDYGPYADADGSLHVCFLATNHTTGGNSGSAVLNARGQLIGLNFDRMWEGCMSDILFDNSLCRNIMVDIRYVLFVIDKFANAQYIMQELDITRH